MKNLTARNAVQHAFTLIELLVVIAIIAILAAILFPVFAQARGKARAASCLSNEKQIMLGFMQYQQDYDETFPIAYDWTGGLWENGPRVWDNQIAPYLGTRPGASGEGGRLLQCPSDAEERDGHIPNGISRSYAMNGAQFFSCGIAPSCGYEGFGAVGNMIFSDGLYTQGLPLSDFPEPATTILLVENPTNRNYAGVTGGAYVENAGRGVSWQHQSGQLANRGMRSAGIQIKEAIHNGGWNYGFVDGHVKWMKPERTYSPWALPVDNDGIGWGMWVRDPKLR